MSGTPRPWQSAAALDKANMVRTQRARIKAELGSLPREEAFAMLADIFVRPPVCCERATAFELLVRVNLVGRHFALRWLKRAGVQEGRYLSELTVRQRRALAGVVRGEERKVAA